MKLVIIGGVAGGATAATRARRLSEDTSIVQYGFEARILSGGMETWQPIQEDREIME